MRSMRKFYMRFRNESTGDRSEITVTWVDEWGAMEFARRIYRAQDYALDEFREIKSAPKKPEPAPTVWRKLSNIFA